MPTSAITAAAKDADRRLISAVLPLGIIMALMLGLSLVGVLLVSWMHAYSYGNVQWSTAEHRAIFQLHTYAITGRESDYQAFLEQLQVPLGDRRARLQLQGTHPDYGRIKAGLLAGHIPPEDIPGVVGLFHLFRHHPLMGAAISHWAAADAGIVQLLQTGERMHACLQPVSAPICPGPNRVRALLHQADELHTQMEPQVTGFAEVIHQASAQVANLVLITLPVAALLLVLLGFSITRSVNRRADSMARALRVLAHRLEFQAHHDALTGLANRARFESLVDETIRVQQRTDGTLPMPPCTLMYFDLDQLKVVNDTCGHAAGDELIKQVAWRVRRMLRTGDTLARLGGDEFGVLLPGCGVEAAIGRAEAIREAVGEMRFYWQGRTHAVSASIGVLELDTQVGSTHEALSAADQACYVAKENGRDRVHLYRPDDQQVQNRRGEMQRIEQLRAALDNDGFVLLAQEIMPLKGQAGSAQHPRKFELLLRLLDADGQYVPPMAFIPAAERYGLMPRIDRWVIARACRELGALRERGEALPVCMINLSGMSVSESSLADYVAACLAENGLSGAQIGFELTETAAVRNLGACAQLMARLKQLGCCIALDDFGSGMCSFSYLRSLPVDLLKIDRSFIRDIVTDPIDYAMVETIHRIGSIMGLRTVAEGVESAQLLERLIYIGVDFAQGFHVHRPTPLWQINAFRGPGEAAPAAPRAALATAAAGAARERLALPGTG